MKSISFPKLELEKMLSLLFFTGLTMFLVAAFINYGWRMKPVDWLNTLALYGLLLAPASLLPMIPATFGNINQYGIRSLGWASLLFIFVMFPVLCIWAVMAAGTLWGLFPEHSLAYMLDTVAAEVFRREFRMLLTYSAGLYGILVVFGLGISTGQWIKSMEPS